jgi:hypothetical protein
VSFSVANFFAKSWGTVGLPLAAIKGSLWASIGFTLAAVPGASTARDNVQHPREEERVGTS